MAQRMPAYLRLLAAFTAGLTIALAGFNGFIDPYGYFAGPKISGINELALGFNHRLPLAKSLAVTRLRPASVILGNSRAETSYDPQHPGFIDQPAYNLGIGGAGLGQVRRYFLEALAAGRLRHVLLALDLSMFEPSLRALEAMPGPILLTDESGKLAGEGKKWQRLAFILLSGTASSDSWWSLTHQRKPVATYRPSGLKEDASDNDQLIREGGHHSASIRAESNFLASNLRDVSSETFRAGYGATLGQLREIIALASERNFRLTIVINPIHARQTYVYAAAGLWPFYEKWKRDLAAAAEQSPRRDLVSLWDFSGISPCTAETMPANGDAVLSMRWYRESSHFRRTLGDLVLDRVFGSHADAVCPGLGLRLETSTVEAALVHQRAALERWIKSHPEDAAEIGKLAKQYGRGSGGS